MVATMPLGKQMLLPSPRLYASVPTFRSQQRIVSSLLTGVKRP